MNHSKNIFQPAIFHFKNITADIFEEIKGCKMNLACLKKNPQQINIKKTLTPI